MKSGVKRMAKLDWDTIRFSSFQSFPGICFVLISDTEPNSEPDSLRYKGWGKLYIFNAGDPPVSCFIPQNSAAIL